MVKVRRIPCDTPGCNNLTSKQSKKPYGNRCRECYYKATRLGRSDIALGYDILDGKIESPPEPEAPAGPPQIRSNRADRLIIARLLEGETSFTQIAKQASIEIGQALKPEDIRRIIQEHPSDFLKSQKRKAIKAAIEEAEKKSEIIIDAGGESRIRLGILADTHLGSKYARLDLLVQTYKWFASEGIDEVYHAGDLVEGTSMRPGHEYELSEIGFTEQRKKVEDDYPFIPGITTHFILGDHCYSYIKRQGAHIGEELRGKRDDLNCIGVFSADLLIGEKKKTRISIEHPGGGTAYAISYRSQKAVESLEPSKRPYLLIFGHFHKMDLIPYQGVIVIQAGCHQDQTPTFMRRKQLAAIKGAWILDIRMNKDGSVKEIIPHLKYYGDQ